MKKLCRFSIFARAFLLLPFLLTSCATPETNLAKDAQLQNYRRVYFVQPDGDPRPVSPRVLARLRETGFEVTDVHSNRFSLPESGDGFVFTPKGLIVHEGSGPGAGEEPPTLICRMGCVSVFDPVWQQWEFQTIRIVFFDFKTGNEVYKVSHFNYDPNVSENIELNRLFLKISDSFFPNGPNPFKGGKEQLPKT